MESTLAYPLSDLKTFVAGYLGWGVTDSDWNTDTTKVSWINQIVKSAVNKVYYCPATQMTPAGYNWSFLHPTTTLTLLTGAQTIQVPDDVAGIEGVVTVTVTGSSSYPTLRPVSEGAVRQQYALFPDTTGIPQAVAQVMLKGTTLTKGQRSELYVWPTADQDYDFTFAYYIMPDMMDGSHPYVYGGAQHSELFKAACQYQAETLLDNLANGPMKMLFMEQLAASIAVDSRNKPQFLGQNRDRSDVMGMRSRNAWWHTEGRIAYNGTVYSP